MQLHRKLSIQFNGSCKATYNKLKPTSQIKTSLGVSDKEVFLLNDQKLSFLKN